MSTSETDGFEIDDEVASSIRLLEKEELMEFAELYEDLTEDKEIELFIFTCVILFIRTDSLEWVDRAIKRAQLWTVSTPLENDQYKRRSKIRQSIRHFAQINRPDQPLGDELAGHRDLEARILRELFEGARYRLTASIEDLTDTINCRGNLLSRLPPTSPERMVGTIGLANLLDERFDKNTNLDFGDLRLAMEITDPLLPHLENFDPASGARLLMQRSKWLELLHRNDEDPTTLDNAIDACHQALCLPLDSDELLYEIRENLARMLLTRGRIAKSLPDLNEAKAILEALLETPAGDSSDHCIVFGNLATCAGRTFTISKNHEELGHAIDHIQTSLSFHPIDFKTRKVLIQNILPILETLTENPEAEYCNGYIDRATKLLENESKKPEWCDFSCHRPLLHLASSLVAYYDTTNNTDYIDQAIEMMEVAAEIAPNGPEKAVCFGTLAMHLRSYFQNTGHHEYQDRAVYCLEQAVHMAPSHSDRPQHLANLGSVLLERYHNFDKSEDLSHGLKHLLEASGSILPSEPMWLAMTQNIALANSFLFNRTQNFGYLQTAIETAENLLIEKSRFNIPHQSEHLYCNLALWLCVRADGNPSSDSGLPFTNRVLVALEKGGRSSQSYKWSVADVDRALHLTKTAIQSINSGHPEWAKFHMTLEEVYMHRVLMFMTRPDLDRTFHSELDLAIQAQEVALQYLPLNNPTRASVLQRLVAALSIRSETTNDPAFNHKAVELCREALNCSGTRPRMHIQIATALGALLMKSHDYQEASQMLEKAVQLLPKACSRSSSNDDRQEYLKDHYGLASMAAAALLRSDASPSRALRVLEIGRGVVAGLFLDARTGLDDLKRAHPGLASKFELLGEQLNAEPELNGTAFPTRAGANASKLMTSRMNFRINLHRDFDELVEKIRQHPGFSDFLLPATTAQMMDAAVDGPIVVINACGYRSDAIIIEKTQISHIGLPYMHWIQVESICRRMQNLASIDSRSSRELTPLLEWLWLVVARPILGHLGFSHFPKDDNWPHVWWIPTGGLAHLPIHAAGMHSKVSSYETVLDRVISSYASSVRSLIHSRQGAVQKDSTNGQQALLISMAETPHQSPLPFAVDEIRAIEPLVRHIGLTIASCKSPQSTDEVLTLMETSRILHFAGHGMSDAKDPSESCLLTTDWENNPLTVKKLRQEGLQDTSKFLAYLSSCSTGAIKNLKMADESTHLINSCQLAGFRHVIGALWEVSDPHCVEVARLVYRTLKEDGLADMAVAKGLHIAIRSIRKSCQSGNSRSKTSPNIEDGHMVENSLENQLEELTQELETFGIPSGEKSDQQRDAVPIKAPRRQQEQFDSFLWVPYVHYGA
ncbi:CHAT domain-containing protein [Penicillium brevicompactum]|uniref:CHAT domain-containing protein n=1 Tax=Penicillium brevicompactum TaxID=5074 RepID=A0A9W9Q7S2_PENBR|nr:CHAT domain-containing protein [Penicillium brevicompactum]